ncbi:MAG: hypothetical protein K8T90_07200, partial [Planctomycetes bacterium]|nr:hypothetical protein [Planctomycetota bacterium]
HGDFNGAPADGSAWESPNANAHVVRDGGYASRADGLRSASRGFGAAPTATMNVVAGFRLARFAEASPADEIAPQGGAATDVSVSTPEVEAEAMKILETYRDATSAHYPDPREKDLVAIGRPALGVFLKVLSDPAFKDQWAMRQAVKRVLATLVLDEDVPMLARLMRDGHREVEVAFANLNAPASIATYAALLREGCFDTGLHEAARPHLREAAVVQACCEWLAEPRYDGDLNFAIATMAELMGGTGPHRLRDDPPSQVAKSLEGHQQPLPAIVPEAGPALNALLKTPLRVDARRHVAAALVRVGDMAGIPALIEILGTPLPNDGPPDAYQRHAAGLQLNGVSRTAMYGKSAFDERTMQVVSEDLFAAAAASCAHWWERAQYDLRFDPATQTWSVR